MKKPTFGKYLKGKLWIILSVNVFVLFFVLPKSLANIDDFSVRFGAYVGAILMNVVWIGTYYFPYKRKVNEYKKLIGEK